MQTEQLERRLILALLDGLPVWKLTLAREFLESMSATMAHTPPHENARGWKELEAVAGCQTNRAHPATSKS